MASSLRLTASSTAAVVVVFLVIISGEVAVGDDATAPPPPPPPIFVFGDSTADVGNNNYINTTAKADFPHNGVDFPRAAATGRFSNAYNGIDFLASHIGFKRSPPPFLSLLNKTSRLVAHATTTGVNFASGGSGILNSTGPSDISLSQQIHYFSTVLSNLISHLSGDQLETLLSKSIFIISSGGNDIFDFFSGNSSSGAGAAAKLVADLSVELSRHIESLYALGARKFAVVGTAPLGCCPTIRLQTANGSCLDELNDVARVVNEESTSVLAGLAVKLPGLRYSIGSSFNVIMDILSNPKTLGFTEVMEACCGGGHLNAEQGCSPAANLCPNRSRYVFWDFVHPTHRTSKIAGAAIYSGGPKFAFPINLKQLVELQ